ncbi:hypothetical protein Salat_2524300 [Sesamum alatum]|uniref:Uncharacterized protein n=1 Tax=Sesamum alatum TaxID=300844 RepID=A0AAE2CCD2_9LAMI|nr:hypothetical protein Salat_2524300 [Sesamum alatum]
MSNLSKRNQKLTTPTPFCNTKGEDSYNIFFRYLTARQQGRWREPEVDRALLLCWRLGNNRNKWLWEKDGATPSDIILRTRQIMFEFEEYNQSLQNTSGALVARRAWQPPPDGFLKLNFDGAIFIESGTASVGIIAHDFGGS